MVPQTILKLSLITLATGARQLVVQDAFEMMWCLAGSYFSWFTPSTTVMSSFFAGAEMMTFFTGPRRCFLASLASVKWPVDSMTTCAPTESQGSAAGSFSLKTLMTLAINRNAVGAGRDLVGQVAENRVVLEQVGQRLRIGEIVDGDEVQVLVGERGAENVTSNASKTINADFYCHVASNKFFLPINYASEITFDGNRAKRPA